MSATAPTPSVVAPAGWVPAGVGYCRPVMLGVLLLLVPEGDRWRAYVDSTLVAAAITVTAGELVDQAAAAERRYGVHPFGVEQWRDRPATRDQLRGLALLSNELEHEARRDGWPRGRCADMLAANRAALTIRTLARDTVTSPRPFPAGGTFTGAPLSDDRGER